MRYEYTATVTRVVDGDTLDLCIDLGLHVTTKTRVRLVGLNAPEHNTDEGKAATDYLKALCEGSEVVIRTQKDKTEKYGRWLAQVWLWPANGISINEILLKTGHAVPYDGGAR